MVKRNSGASARLFKLDKLHTCNTMIVGQTACRQAKNRHMATMEAVTLYDFIWIL